MKKNIGVITDFEYHEEMLIGLRIDFQPRTTECTFAWIDLDFCAWKYINQPQLGLRVEVLFDDLLYVSKVTEALEVIHDLIIPEYKANNRYVFLTKDDSSVGSVHAFIRDIEALQLKPGDKVTAYTVTSWEPGKLIKPHAVFMERA